MSTGYFLQSTKPNGPIFEILKYDPETHRATLVGKLGTPFEETISKEYLDKWHYRVVSKEKLHAQQPHVQA